MAIVLALMCALAYGSADFVCGLASRRLHYAVVGTVAQGIATVAAAVAVAVTGGTPSLDALGWGALSGVGSGLGSAALYRGLARGQMSVVGPLSGAGSAAIPVVAGLLLGDRPSAVTLVGVVLVVPAVWLISSSGRVTRGSVVEGAVDGILAGAGFGLIFLALARAGDGAGLWPVLAGAAVSFVLVGAFALAVRRRDSTVRADAPGRSRAWLGTVAGGLLGSAATLTYFLSTRHGLLVVVAVLGALYPGVTVLLARLLLHERSSRLQLVGLAVAAVAVVAITVG